MIGIKRNKDRNLKKYKWHIDCLTAENISGWVYNTGKNTDSAKVEVRSGNTILWSSIAEVFRQDLLDAKIGSGNHAFTITPDSNSVSGSISKVDIYIDGYKAETDLPFEMIEANIDDYRVQLDHSAIEKVTGWVFNPENIAYRAKIEVRAGQTVIACGLANEYRQDLLNAGFGDGAYGYTLIPNVDVFPQSECECKLFVDGLEANTKSFVLVTDTSTIEQAKYQQEFSAEILDYTQNVTDKLGVLKEEIVSANKNMNEDDFAVNGQLQVAINSIADLSVRINVIEQVLLKKLSKI
jgi:hypothetical protein